MTAPGDRACGCLLGLAVGDALGTTLEFRRPGTFDPIDDMVGGGPFHLGPGEWTDDTSMARCLAESLAECGFDEIDQLQRYVRWWRDGHMSVTGHCFDIGRTVRHALDAFLAAGAPAAPGDEHSAGNGSIMRLAPVPIWASRSSLPEVAEYAARSSRTTHAAPEAVDACRYMGVVLAGLLRGLSREEVLSPRYWEESVPGGEPLMPRIAEIAAGSFRERTPPEIRGTGYVVESLEAALWAFAQAGSFRHGALVAVNLGDDADTTGAVYGQFAGAWFGASGIPSQWRERVAWRERIEAMAVRLSDGHSLPRPD